MTRAGIALGNRTATERDAQRLSVTTELCARLIQVPHDGVVTAPRRSLLSIRGCSAALDASRRHDAFGSSLVGVFVCVLRLGHDRRAARVLQYHRSGTRR